MKPKKQNLKFIIGMCTLIYVALMIDLLLIDIGKYSDYKIFKLTIFVFILYNLFGDIMKVKIFDLEDELDLENEINSFLDNLNGEVIDIKYQVSVGVFSEEQVFCFSAMIIYC